MPAEYAAVGPLAVFPPRRTPPFPPYPLSNVAISGGEKTSLGGYTAQGPRSPYAVECSISADLCTDTLGFVLRGRPAYRSGARTYFLRYAVNVDSIQIHSCSKTATRTPHRLRGCQAAAPGGIALVLLHVFFSSYTAPAW